MFNNKYLLTLALSTLFLAACSSGTPNPIVKPDNANEQVNDQESLEKEPLKIVATFYPLYDFASKVAGSEATIDNIVPPGVEPHEYEPSPKDMQKIYEADLLIYNGAGVDAWVDGILPDLEKNKVRVLNMSKMITLLSAEQHQEEEEHQEGHEEDEGDHGHEDLTHDPHFWLDPVLAKKQIESIEEVLLQLNPENKAIFEKNTQDALDKLIALDKEYTQGLQTCVHKQAVVTHNAFRYLAQRYNIELLPISGMSPEEEPSAKALADLATLSKENKIKYVFFETLASPKLAQTLADEIGAQTLVLNPIEGLTQEQQEEGQDYISVMEDNLKNLKIAMECQ